jgi:hypothetical protein
MPWLEGVVEEGKERGGTRWWGSCALVTGELVVTCAEQCSAVQGD